MSINNNNSRYGNKKTVLVVDDNEDFASLFVQLLELNDFQVVGIGHDGKDAVELYEQQRPDITFLDVIMPNTDGIYALDHIREINPEAVIIMVTTDLSQDLTKQLQNLKANAVIHKPFDIKDLVKIVKDIESEENIGQIKFFT